MSQEKKKKRDKQIEFIGLHLDAIQNDINILFETVGDILSQPVGCGGNCDCIKDDEPYVSPTGIGQSVANTGTVTWISPETKVAALEEANESLSEQLEDVEQEADSYATQIGELTLSLDIAEAKFELLRKALYDIAI